MCQRAEELRDVLADALVWAANQPGSCIAEAIGMGTSEDIGSWCLACTISEKCWAWQARGILSWQVILAALRRYERNRSGEKVYRGWGVLPASPIQIIARSKQV